MVITTLDAQKSISTESNRKMMENNPCPNPSMIQPCRMRLEIPIHTSPARTLGFVRLGTKASSIILTFGTLLDGNLPNVSETGSFRSTGEKADPANNTICFQWIPMAILSSICVESKKLKHQTWNSWQVFFFSNFRHVVSPHGCSGSIDWQNRKTLIPLNRSR